MDYVLIAQGPTIGFAFGHVLDGCHRRRRRGSEASSSTSSTEEKLIHKPSFPSMGIPSSLRLGCWLLPNLTHTRWRPPGLFADCVEQLHGRRELNCRGFKTSDRNSCFAPRPRQPEQREIDQ